MFTARKLICSLLLAATVLTAMPASASFLDDAYDKAVARDKAIEAKDKAQLGNQAVDQAQADDADAQFRTGMKYVQGTGVAKDPAEAVRWFQKAAEGGNVNAQFSLSSAYRSGYGVPKDAAAAAHWQQIATGEHIVMLTKDQAQASLKKGIAAYEDGELGDAVKILLPLAEQGNVTAQFGLGVIYMTAKMNLDAGQAISSDMGKAIKWSTAAAEQGNTDAMNNLGVMYSSGMMIDAHTYPIHDYQQALKWWRPAAEQGNANAQYGMGVLYQEGKGVARDKAQAIQWYQKSAAQGNIEAQKKLEKMHKNSSTLD